MKRIISKSNIERTGDMLTIRPGFLEDGDMDMIECERKAAIGQNAKFKVNHSWMVR